jgi:hypothetical protein
MKLHLVVEPHRTTHRSPIAFALYRGLSSLGRRATHGYWTEPEAVGDAATWSFLRSASVEEIAAHLGRGKAVPFSELFEDLVLDVPAELDPRSLASFAEAASVVIACGPTAEAETLAAELWGACSAASARTGGKPVVLVASYAGQAEIAQRRTRVARLLSLAGAPDSGSGPLLEEPVSWLEPAPKNDSPFLGTEVNKAMDEAGRVLARDLLARIGRGTDRQ